MYMVWSCLFFSDKAMDWKTRRTVIYNERTYEQYEALVFEWSTRLCIRLACEISYINDHAKLEDID